MIKSGLHSWTTFVFVFFSRPGGNDNILVDFMDFKFTLLFILLKGQNLVFIFFVVIIVFAKQILLAIQCRVSISRTCDFEHNFFVKFISSVFIWPSSVLRTFLSDRANFFLPIFWNLDSIWKSTTYFFTIFSTLKILWPFWAP